jgi:preprotein translocase subunit SecA/nephrocystin-3
MINLSQDIKSREIRIFLSSTFKDMNSERDYLVKRTFPRLRNLAKEKSVVLIEVDLRWGITEEEAQQGKVVKICLNEIERCKPFFIGILGHRYGWIPDEGSVDRDTLEAFPVAEAGLKQRCSVTEMEIRQGVLEDPKMHQRSFFHYRKESPSEFSDIIGPTSWFSESLGFIGWKVARPENQ